MANSQALRLSVPLTILLFLVYLLLERAEAGILALLVFFPVCHLLLWSHLRVERDVADLEAFWWYSARRGFTLFSEPTNVGAELIAYPPGCVIQPVIEPAESLVPICSVSRELMVNWIRVRVYSSDGISEGWIKAQEPDLHRLEKAPELS